MAHPLYVALVWHQHQPDYRDPSGGPALMPWARLHAAKDYLHMAELVADFPKIHCTFNYVPSLAEQIASIGAGKYVDAWQVLSLKESWTEAEKQFLLDHFFSVHPRLLARYPPYVRLAQYKQVDSKYLNDQYWMDLAAWFNLAWFDARAIARDEQLTALVEKGENFTRQDMAVIIDKQRDLAARVLPFHRELAARGQIEISVSPYYHPILPLLIDQRSAREAIPNLPLPATLFAHPEDAAEQLRRAVLAHRTYFGQSPRGLWTSEGSVSDALPKILPENFSWMASDENILARSLGKAIERDHEGHLTNPRVLYQPYARPLETSRHQGRSPLQANSLALIFRDHALSDRIGFAYQYMPAHDAAQDLIYRLHTIRERLADDEHAYLVSIILDGENAWESYEDNGDPFFRELYGALANDPTLRTVTVSEYLHENRPRRRIGHIAAGSWINGNFDTWIGEPAQNRAWDLLADARTALGAWEREYSLADEGVMARAWDELYIAEGSDWFWWYSSRNHSAQDTMFDELFRGHLQRVYATIGLPVPDSLREPIRKAAAEIQERGITAVITPSLRATPDDLDEWNGAGAIAPESAGGTMQRAETGLVRVLYGYDSAKVFFRVEGGADLAAARVSVYLQTPRAERYNSRPRGAESNYGLSLSWEISVDPRNAQGDSPIQAYRADGQGVWKSAPVQASAIVRDRIVEIAVPLQDVNLHWGDSAGILVAITNPEKQTLVGTLPTAGAQPFTLGAL